MSEKEARKEAIGTEGNGGLARRWWAREQHGTTGNSTLLNHLEDHTRGLPSLCLTDHALRASARFETVIESKTAYV